MFAIVTAIKSLERFGPTDYSDIAEYMKIEFNNKFGRTWHCLCILRGGFSVQNETGCYICLDISDDRIGKTFASAQIDW